MARPNKEITVSRTIGAPVDRVFLALTEPSHLAAWLAEEVSSKSAAGDFLSLAWPSLSKKLELEVLESSAASGAIGFSAQIPGQPRQTQRFELTSQESGTEVAMAMSPFQTAEAMADAESGWSIALAHLQIYLEYFFDLPRSSAWVIGAAHGSRQRIAQVLGPSGWDSWLADDLVSTDPCSPSSPGNDPIPTARVHHSASSGETCLRCLELPAAVALRRLPAGADTWLVGAQLSVWAAENAYLDNLRRRLAPAVDRLIRNLAPATGHDL